MADEIVEDLYQAPEWLSGAALLLLARQDPDGESAGMRKMVQEVQATGTRMPVTVELRLNGSPVSFRALIHALEESYEQRINEEAGKLLLTIFRERRAALEGALSLAESGLRMELYKLGLLSEGDLHNG
jgi:hypothetical protein